MSEAVRHLLELFDALTDSEKSAAVDEILQRTDPGDRQNPAGSRRRPLAEGPPSGLTRIPPAEGDIPTGGLDALADELFAKLDAEENARAADR